MEGSVVAGGAEAFGMDGSGFLASFAFFYFGFPVDFFIAGVAEAFGMVFFFFGTIDTGFYHHAKIKRSHVKYFVQTGKFRSFYTIRTSYNVYCANFGVFFELCELFWFGLFLSDVVFFMLDVFVFCRCGLLDFVSLGWIVH